MASDEDGINGEIDPFGGFAFTDLDGELQGPPLPGWDSELACTAETLTTVTSDDPAQALLPSDSLDSKPKVKAKWKKKAKSPGPPRKSEVVQADTIGKRKSAQGKMKAKAKAVPPVEQQPPPDVTLEQPPLPDLPPELPLPLEPELATAVPPPQRQPPLAPTDPPPEVPPQPESAAPPPEVQPSGEPRPPLPQNPDTAVPPTATPPTPQPIEEPVPPPAPPPSTDPSPPLVIPVSTDPAPSPSPKKRNWKAASKPKPVPPVVPAPAPEPAPEPVPPPAPPPVPVREDVADNGVVLEESPPAKPGEAYYGEVVFDPPPHPANLNRYEVRPQSDHTLDICSHTSLSYVGGFFILFFVICLGWNEKRAVCDARAISSARTDVVEASCNSVGSTEGKLIIFSCYLRPSGSNWTLSGTSVFANEYYIGTCLNTIVEMYQCVEHVTQQQVVVNGQTGMQPKFTYAREFRNSQVDSSTFNANARASSAFHICSTDPSFQNPGWPSDTPAHGTTFAHSALVGPYTVTGAFLPSLACQTDIEYFQIPPNWTKSAGKYQRGPMDNLTGWYRFGHVRVSFQTSAWMSGGILYTVVGKNQGGIMVRWKAPSSWLCSGSEIAAVVKSGRVSEDQIFDELEDTNHTLTWCLRFLYFFCLWPAFCCLFGPLDVAADLVPFVGKLPFLGELIGNVLEKLLCALTFPPSICLCIGVCTVVWIAMRPGVVLPIFFIFLISMFALIYFGKKARDWRKEEREEMMKWQQNH